MNDLLIRQLADAGQLHLLEEIDILDQSVLERFESELELIDWEGLAVAADGGGRAGDLVEPVAELPHLVRHPEAGSQRARDRGEAVLADGRVAVVTVAVATAVVAVAAVDASRTTKYHYIYIIVLFLFFGGVLCAAGG